MRPADSDDADDEGFRDEPSLVSRLLWRMVWVLSAVLLLAAVTFISVAMLAPDALSGACVRVQLVRPEECSPRLGNVQR